MAESLATDHRVTLIACSGHELDHLGLRHHLSARKSDSARVVHLGASIGAVETDADGTAVLGSQRYALTNASDDLRASIADRVLDAKWTMLDVDPWPGEGETWRASGAIVLSFVGQFPYFHTAADVPDRATTPSALELAAAVAIDAAHRFAAIR
jgi:hypothetical protein